MFIENVELDACMVMAGMKGGFEAICHMAIMTRGFKGPDEVMERCDGFKKQPKAYKNKVIKKVLELEKNENNTI